MTASTQLTTLGYSQIFDIWHGSSLSLYSYMVLRSLHGKIIISRKRESFLLSHDFFHSRLMHVCSLLSPLYGFILSYFFTCHKKTSKSKFISMWAQKSPFNFKGWENSINEFNYQETLDCAENAPPLCDKVKGQNTSTNY